MKSNAPELRALRKQLIPRRIAARRRAQSPGGLRDGLRLVAEMSEGPPLEVFYEGRAGWDRFLEDKRRELRMKLAAFRICHRRPGGRAPRPASNGRSRGSLRKTATRAGPDDDPDLPGPGEGADHPDVEELLAPAGAGR